ncbi:MAG: acoA [Gammaproteobacteria bacterium]|jgi:pyruvate dehydrogenase E1 component alpha subunit|nr:acoA [Gammaproteobacteria bacterium]
MIEMSPALTVRLYKKMLLIRKIELRIAEIYHTDAIKSPVHLSVGQESIAVGVCDPLAKDDIVSNTYRCHATYIAKGGDLNGMMAELYGKRTGCAGGKAGSMHLVDIPNGVMGASAVVGTTIPVATGYALALQQEAKITGRQRVVVALCGDGGTEEGCFYESLNFAALKKLPIIFIVENNRLAIHTPLEKRWATEQLCERVATFGIKTYKIDDADVFKIRETMVNALAEIREGSSGPLFIECATYRWLEHVGPLDDHSDDYRDCAEYQYWKDNDQITRLANLLAPETRVQIENEVILLMQNAEKFAEESPYPTAEELYTHVYA